MCDELKLLKNSKWFVFKSERRSTESLFVLDVSGVVGVFFLHKFPTFLTIFSPTVATYAFSLLQLFCEILIWVMSSLS